MSEILKAIQICKSFHIQGEEKLEVLKNLNFSMNQGETVCIKGTSGSGKSTLLHILGTLDRPHTGKVLFKGQELVYGNTYETALFRNENLGFIFQFHHLLPEFTALENVLMPVLVSSHKVKNQKKRAEELLEFVELKERMRHKPYELSGGEQQRVALARALIQKPALILADEPTGNLDSHNAHNVFSLLKDSIKEFQTSLLFVTHNEELISYADQTYTLKEGILEALGLS
ncbi:MAG: ABC transporter ATP-binding protein [Deltaproteobacteria bacterium]|nr:ABC transporter ATP-binding protein [Deltaproteobacteria bacterium]